MQKRHSSLLAGAWILLLSLLACRPVFAIGWGELVILLLLISILLGPILFRLARAWQTRQELKRKKE